MLAHLKIATQSFYISADPPPPSQSQTTKNGLFFSTSLNIFIISKGFLALRDVLWVDFQQMFMERGGWFDQGATYNQLPPNSIHSLTLVKASLHCTQLYQPNPIVSTPSCTSPICTKPICLLYHTELCQTHHQSRTELQNCRKQCLVCHHCHRHNTEESESETYLCLCLCTTHQSVQVWG